MILARLPALALLPPAQEKGPPARHGDAPSAAEPGDGSPAKPFRAISDAMDAARADVRMKPEVTLREKEALPKQ